MNGSGNALGGHEAEHHAHVDEALQHHREGDPRGEVEAEVVGGLPGRPQPAPQEEEEGQDHRGRAQQAELLPDHRVDEVAVGIGQIEELLPPFHEAEAGDAARAHRDQALDDLVARAPRVRPRVQEGLDAVAPVGRGHDDLIEDGKAQEAEGGEVAQAHAGQEEHHRPREGEGGGAAEVGLDEDEEGEPAEEEEGGEERGQELVDPVAAALEVVGEEEDDRDLGELGGLEGEAAQADPAMDVVHRPQEEDDDEEEGA